MAAMAWLCDATWVHYGKTMGKPWENHGIPPIDGHFMPVFMEKIMAKMWNDV